MCLFLQSQESSEEEDDVIRHFRRIQKEDNEAIRRLRRIQKEEQLQTKRRCFCIHRMFNYW